jgi:hypothetical protein
MSMVGDAPVVFLEDQTLDVPMGNRIEMRPQVRV